MSFWECGPTRVSKKPVRFKRFWSGLCLRPPPFWLGAGITHPKVSWNRSNSCTKGLMIFDTLASAIPAEQVPQKFPDPKYAHGQTWILIFTSRRGNTMLQNTASPKTWQRYQYHPSQYLADQSWEARVGGVLWSENRRCSDLEGLESWVYHWEVIAQYVEHMDDDVIIDTVSYLIGSVSQGGNRSVIHLVLL